MRTSEAVVDTSLSQGLLQLLIATLVANLVEHVVEVGALLVKRLGHTALGVGRNFCCKDCVAIIAERNNFIHSVADFPIPTDGCVLEEEEGLGSQHVDAALETWPNAAIIQSNLAHFLGEK